MIGYSTLKACTYTQISYNMNSRVRRSYPISLENVHISKTTFPLLNVLTTLFPHAMQAAIDSIFSALSRYNIDSACIQNIEESVNEEMKVDGWVSLILRNRECVVLKFNDGIFLNEGYFMNDDEILKVLGNYDLSDISYSKELLVEGIVDLDHGARFEGLVLNESGIPFGYGEMYDNRGLLVYKGIMINWKRFGYGVSYHDNGYVEYEGYWCDNNRFGIGKVYDRKMIEIKECSWWNGNESEVDYEGDGSNLNIKVTSLHLFDSCMLNNFDISMFLNLKSVKIGNECFNEVKTFRIEGMSKLKTIMIGFNSFTQKKNDLGSDKSKSFHILDCESLESIEIGDYSFSDFAGDFELKNLPALEFISVGYCGSDSFNFYESSFEVRGKKNRYRCDTLDFPKLKSIQLGDGTFGNSHTFKIERLDNLELIDIGNNCFSGVKTFNISEMNKLKQLYIGANSFTQKRKYWGTNPSKSFHIINCESLESIEIGDFSFSNFDDIFELRNLPSLQYITVGMNESRSYDLTWDSVLIRGTCFDSSILCRTSYCETHSARLRDF